MAENDYTWISLVDLHTGKNIGVLIMDGHIEAAVLRISQEDFLVTPEKDQKFFRESEKGRIYLQAELRENLNIVNRKGEDR